MGHTHTHTECPPHPPGPALTAVQGCSSDQLQNAASCCKSACRACYAPKHLHRLFHGEYPVNGPKSPPTPPPTPPQHEILSVPLVCVCVTSCPDLVSTHSARALPPLNLFTVTCPCQGHGSPAGSSAIGPWGRIRERQRCRGSEGSASSPRTGWEAPDRGGV